MMCSEVVSSQSASPQVVLLTGAGGKLGLPFTNYLRQRGYDVRALVRDPSTLPAGFDAALDWESAKTDTESLDRLLKGVGSIVHLASSGSPDQQQNIDAHLCMPALLLDRGKACGVERFIALSSIKAITGEASRAPVDLECVPAPNSDYGRYKLKAERLIAEHAANEQLATWTLRLPMVYGSETQSGFDALRRAAHSGIPLPVAADNRRSFLYSENLFACLVHLLQQPLQPGNRLLHIADGEAISTKAFFRLISDAQGSSGRCITLPSALSHWLSRVPVIGALSTRLLGSLEFDLASLQLLPNWQMPYTTAAGVAAAIARQRQE